MRRTKRLHQAVSPEVRHAAGPWSIDDTPDGLYIQSRTRDIACITSGLGRSCSEAQTMANAAVLRSAPELLAACQDAARWIASIGAGEPRTTCSKRERRAIARRIDRAIVAATAVPQQAR